MKNQMTDMYTNEQLHEAFSIEVEARKQLNRQLNDERHKYAIMKYDRDKFMDKFLRLHIEKHVSINGDVQVELDKYFNDKTREVFFTPQGGYYCTVQHEDCVFIMFAWSNRSKWRQEAKDMLSLIKSISNTSRMPLRYSGVNNVMKKHSLEIAPTLWELKL